MADENEAITLREEKLRLSSPPKLTRVTQIKTGTTPQRKECGQNTSSLPALAGEIAVAQKNQVLRLEKRMEFFEKLQIEYREALRLRGEAEKHTQAVLRKSNLLQDDIESCQKNCESLRKEVDILVTNTEEIKGIIANEKHDAKNDKCNYEEYQQKMTQHQELTELAESSDAVNVNMRNKIRYYEMLQQEKKTLHKENDIQKVLSGELKEILMAELFTLEESISELKETLKRKFQAVDEKEKQTKLRKDVELLQKKNQAQLAWTRKQLQETTSRNKQWNDETSQKEIEIQEKRRKIEQC